MKGVNEQQQQWLELKYTGHLGGVPPMGVGHVQEKRGGDPEIDFFTVSCATFSIL